MEEPATTLLCYRGPEIGIARNSVGGMRFYPMKAGGWLGETARRRASALLGPRPSWAAGGFIDHYGWGPGRKTLLDCKDLLVETVTVAHLGQPGKWAEVDDVCFHRGEDGLWLAETDPETAAELMRDPAFFLVEPGALPFASTLVALGPWGDLTRLWMEKGVLLPRLLRLHGLEGRVLGLGRILASSPEAHPIAAASAPLDRHALQPLHAWLEGASKLLDCWVRAGIAARLALRFMAHEAEGLEVARGLVVQILAQDSEAAWGWLSSRFRLELPDPREDGSIGPTPETWDMTGWLAAFFVAAEQALQRLEETLLAEIQGRFIEHPAHPPVPEAALNPRQEKALEALRTGGMTALSTRTYVELNGCSRATAYRDLADLVAKGLLVSAGAVGRDTAYAFQGG